MTSSVSNILLSLSNREAACWAMAKVFLENCDAHGLHDMGVEIQALQRAKQEIEKCGVINAEGRQLADL